MCGIVGIYGHRYDCDLKKVAGDMVASLVHRGPDDDGIWGDDEAEVAFGHRRLSVIDLSHEGHQPMLSRDGRYVMVFNGEVYNHQLLRVELEDEREVNWRGHSDTEVMLEAIARWGIKRALSKFIGMFAIALFDRTERKLHLIRDRVGEKPLYYGWCAGAFVFGSELKALRKYPGFAGEIDRDVLALYLRHTAVPDPFTIYQRIYKVQPGCIVSLDLSGSRNYPNGFSPHAPFSISGLSLSRWWSLHEVAESGQSKLITKETEALGLLEFRLRESVRLQSLADVPLGAFLSGGIDSSLITALMQSESNSPINTFTIGFQEKKYNEAEHARKVASHLGTKHIELFVTAKDALDLVQQLPDLYDEPFADSSQIPTHLLCCQAKKHLTVALSGDAGDELFGGYNRYFWLRKVWSKVSWLPNGTRQLFAKAILSLPAHCWDTFYSRISCLLTSSSDISFVGQKLHNLAKRLVSIKNEDELFFSLVSEWSNPDKVVKGASEPVTLLTKTNDWPTLPDIEHRMMYLDAMTYLPNDILVKVDRAAMSTSLETRTPFLDHRVVELAWQLPLSMKLRNNQGKWALRQILYKYVPRELIERPKQGFGVPLGEWLRGPLKEWAEELISEERLLREGYFNPDPIRSKWSEHLSGTRNWEHSLWAILMFQAWLESIKN
jgi:asparagine synthase (glutamine-hydrolysing)